MLIAVDAGGENAVDVHPVGHIDLHLPVRVKIRLVGVVVQLHECARLAEHGAVAVEDGHRRIEIAAVVGALREHRAAHVILPVGVVAVIEQIRARALKDRVVDPGVRQLKPGVDIRRFGLKLREIDRQADGFHQRLLLGRRCIGFRFLRRFAGVLLRLLRLVGRSGCGGNFRRAGFHAFEQRAFHLHAVIILIQEQTASDAHQNADGSHRDQDGFLGF